MHTLHNKSLGWFLHLAAIYSAPPTPPLEAACLFAELSRGPGRDAASLDSGQGMERTPGNMEIL